MTCPLTLSQEFQFRSGLDNHSYLDSVFLGSAMEGEVMVREKGERSDDSIFFFFFVFLMTEGKEKRIETTGMVK